jgi:hypothetical protein
MSYLADPGAAAHRRFERGKNPHEGEGLAVPEVLAAPLFRGPDEPGNGLAARRKNGG